MPMAFEEDGQLVEPLGKGPREKPKDDALKKYMMQQRLRAAAGMAGAGLGSMSQNIGQVRQSNQANQINPQDVITPPEEMEDYRPYMRPGRY